MKLVLFFLFLAVLFLMAGIWVGSSPLKVMAFVCFAIALFFLVGELFKRVR
jgi:hypothetical protein